MSAPQKPEPQRAPDAPGRDAPDPPVPPDQPVIPQEDPPAEPGRRRNDEPPPMIARGQ